MMPVPNYLGGMKLFPFLTTLLLGFSLVAAAQAPVRVPVTLREVTVYRSAAELRQTAERAVPAGVSEIRLTGLAPGLLSAGLQVEVEGAELLSSALVRLPAPVSTSDSAALAEKALYRLQAEREAASVEKDFLLQNKTVPVGDKESYTGELQKGAEYFRKRIYELTLKFGELDRTIAAKQLEVRVLRSRGQGTTAGNLALDVQVRTPAAATARFRLTYVVPGSWWQPRHDVRLSDPGKPLEVVNRAVVHNASGLDWKGVRVSLLTANPSIGALRPALQPWALRYSGESLNEGRLDDFATRAKASAADRSAPAGNGRSSAEQSEPSEENTDDFADRFGVAAEVSVPNGGAQLVQLGTAKAAATLEYLTVPKLDPGVFLLAKVTGWEKLKLMADSANVYLRGAYLGQTLLNTRAFGDTLELALGRDPLVEVNRTKREDYASKSGLGKRTVKLTYEIAVRNLHKTAIKLRVLDQIPIAQEEDIKVTFDPPKGAVLDKDSGRLTWQFGLNPSENLKLPFSFEIEYPKNKHVNLNRNRNVRSPKFR